MRLTSTVTVGLLATPFALAAPVTGPVTVTVTAQPTTVISEKVVYTVTVTASCLASTTHTTTPTSVSATTTSSALNTNPYPTSTLLGSDTQGLNDLAKATGKLYLGTAADIPGPELSDVGYMTVLNNSHEFGQLTPANYMKACCLKAGRHSILTNTAGSMSIRNRRGVSSITAVVM